MAEVRYAYADIAFRPVGPARGSFEVENRFYFTSLDGYDIVYTVEADGKAVRSGTVRLQTAPQQRETVDAARAEYGDDLAVVCYVNSTVEIKSWSDVCVTSSNAVKIVSELPQQHVLFIPDQNLGRFVAEQVPQKHVILNNGYCPRHHIITVEQIVDAKEAPPDALVLAHPECKADVLTEADYIGSTAGIIKYAEESDASEFIIVTVRGVLYELERRCQGTGKKFYFPAVQPTCVNMDLITLEKLVRCLETGEGEVQIGVSDEAADQAKLTLDRMLEYAAR